MADINDCALHEGYPNPCVILGADRGELLYGLGVFGWFGILTLPIGAAGCAVAVFWAVVLAVGDRIKRHEYLKGIHGLEEG